jgi:hypothetical protein
MNRGVFPHYVACSLTDYHPGSTVGSSDYDFTFFYKFNKFSSKLSAKGIKRSGILR